MHGCSILSVQSWHAQDTVACCPSFALYKSCRLLFDCFRVYRCLESIPTSHDEEEEKVAAELAELLGPERMPWLQLVHQLIVSEEVMQAEQ